MNYDGERGDLLCYIENLEAHIGRLEEENERLRESLALERGAYAELEIDYHNAEHGLALADSENERLKAEIEDLQFYRDYFYDPDAQTIRLSKRDGEALLEIINNPKESNEKIKKIMYKYAGVGEKEESTANLQDAVDGAEKASKRIDDWPTWKQSMAYRYHDTDGDKEKENG